MKKRLLAICLLVALLLSGCSKPQQADKNILVASFYPVYIMALNVVEDVEDVEVVSLTAPTTGCLHDYQLLTSDMRTLSGAKALLINGAGMEDSFLPAVIQSFPELPVLDLSAGIDLICGEEHGEDHEGHDHGEYNAHMWLDPQNAAIMVRNMADMLSESMPEHSGQFQQNANSYIEKLSVLDAELKAGLEGVANRDIVTFHEAFPYFAKAYDLNVVAVVALEPDEGVSPRMLTELAEKVTEAGNPPLFTEPQYASNAAQALSQETGAEIYELDPLASGEADKDAYLDGMRKNLQVLLEALK